MNQKGFSNTVIILIVLVVVLAGALGYITLVKKPTSVEQSQSNNLPSTQQTSTQTTNNSSTSSVQPTTKAVDWASLASDIQVLLKKQEFSGMVEVGRPKYPENFVQKADITGDGIEEALVGFGSGAYMGYLTLIQIENGKPVVAQFKQKDGKISSLMFLDGASVRNGARVAMLPEKNAIYSGSWGTDDYGKVNNCSLDAYQWNSKTNTFDFNITLSNELKPDFCRKAGS